MILGAFLEDKLIGYTVNVVTNHLHYADLLIVQNDIIFLCKEHRKGRLGLQLIKRTEEEAKKLGARLCIWHGKVGTALAGILPKLGYGEHEIIYTKEIEP